MHSCGNLIRCFVLLLVLAMPAQGQAAEGKLYPLVIHASESAHLFQVELADTPETLARGLMWRRELAPGHGMLFVFPEPREVAFWMRNTLIPLDMVFIKQDLTIGHIHADARPLDESGIPSKVPVIAVLEIAGGQAAEQGLNIGDKVETSLLEASK